MRVIQSKFTKTTPNFLSNREGGGCAPVLDPSLMILIPIIDYMSTYYLNYMYELINKSCKDYNNLDGDNKLILLMTNENVQILVDFENWNIKMYMY